MLRTPILQVQVPSLQPMSGQNHPRAKQWQHFLTSIPGAPPRAAERTTATPDPVLGLRPSLTCTGVCTRLTPGRPPPHQGRGESPDTRARETMLPVPDHAAHARATGVIIQHQCQGLHGPPTCHWRPRQPHLCLRTRRAGHRAPRALPSPSPHSPRAGAQGPARRARGPPYLPPSAGLGPPPLPRPPPPSWAPQGPDSLTPLPQGAGAGAKAASAPRGTLRPLRKPHSAASGDHGDGRGAAAPSGAREGSGAEAGASGALGRRGPGAWGRWARGSSPAVGAGGLRRRPGGAGPAALHAGKGETPGSTSFRSRVTGFSVGEAEKQSRITGELVHLGGGRREMGSTSSGVTERSLRGRNTSSFVSRPHCPSPPCPALCLASRGTLGQL